MEKLKQKIINFPDLLIFRVERYKILKGLRKILLLLLLLQFIKCVFRKEGNYKMPQNVKILKRVVHTTSEEDFLYSDFNKSFGKLIKTRII